MLQSNSQKVLSLLMLFMLALTGSMEVKGADTSDFTFNSGVRYSQWVTKSRIGSYTANTTKNGFAVYDAQGNKLSGRTDGKSELDYVPGLVAKAIIENVQYYSQYPWAQSWSLPFFYSIADYGNAFYNKYKSTYGSLDDLNAAKVFFGLYELTNTGGAYASNNVVTSASTTKAHAQEALRRAMEGENGNEGIIKHNSDRRIENNTPAYLAGHTIVEGGWWHKTAYANEMWLDGSYMGPALFAQLHNYNGSDIIGDDWTIVYRQIQALWEMCWNSTDKLLYHAFSAKSKDNYSATWAGFDPDNGVFHSASYWGRACGWYFLALIDILEQMDKAGLSNTTNYATLKSHLSDLAAGLAARQDATTGCWYQLLDEDGTFHTSTYNNGENHSDTYNYIESSASALFTAGYLKAMRLGYLSGSTVPTGCSKNYETIAKDGYKGLVNNFFAIDGNEGVHIFGSCRSAGLGNKNSSAGSSNYRDGSKAYYLLGGDVTREAKASNITNRVTEGKALGGFILAATEYERAYQNNMVLFEKDLAPTYSLTAGDQITCPASGSGESISYKWYKVVNEYPVEVATGATFTPEESGEYYCTATSGNTITSSHTQVTVSGEAPAETTYTVTFNATTNGGSCATASLTQASSGASITLPTATKSGYTFNGWYTASTGGTLKGAANASYTPTANETLYAQFTENSGTGGEGDCTIKIGNSNANSYAATFTSSSTNGSVTASATAFTVGSSIGTSNSTNSYATAPYSVKYKPSGNINTSEYSDNYSISAQFTVASGYTFTPSAISATIVTEATGYTYQAILTDGTTTYTSNDVASSSNGVSTFSFPSLSGTALSGTVTFKIRFKSTANNSKYFIVNLPITISGEVNSAGGEPSKTTNTLALTTESGEVTEGNTLDITSYVSTNSDATVTYTSNNPEVATVENGVITGVSEGTTTITVEQEENEDYTSGSTAFTITVNPAPVPTTNYTVKFYNGNTQFGDSQSIEEGSTVSAPATSPTKDGYTFKGWALSEGSTARVLFPYPVYEDVNFYAVWSNTTQSGGGDEEIFKATATATLSVAKTTTGQEITSDNAEISGGKMYAYSGQDNEKNLIGSNDTYSGGDIGFCFTNNNTFFKIELDEPLQAGDKITAKSYTRTDVGVGIWMSTETSRPDASSTKIVTDVASTTSWVTLPEYTVIDNDGICGESTIYLYRAEGKTIYFTDFTITREGEAVGSDITLETVSDYENFESYAGENKTVTFKRNFTEGKWTTLVLPFSVNATQLGEAFEYANDCELANIQSMTVNEQGTGSISYVTTNQITANTPVLAKIKPNDGLTGGGFTANEYVFSGVKVVNSETATATSNDGNVTMYGVYENTARSGISLDDEEAYFLYNGKFYDFSWLSNMTPFTAYIVPQTTSGNALKGLTFEEDSATGIINLNVNPNLNSLSHGEGWGESFNLAGQKVGKEYKGMVIKKGKKVIKK